MEILKVTPVTKNDIAVKRNTEVIPKSYFNALFQINNKTYTATIRISTNHIADCRNEKDAPVKLREETEMQLIEEIAKYNKKKEV